MAVGEGEFYFYVGVAALVGGEHAGEFVAGKPNGGGDAQRALRVVGACAGVFGGLGEQFQRALAVAVVGIALLGEFQAAVVAVEQLRADGFFQMGDVFACHGDGDVEQVGGAGEAAALHNLAEDFHAQ